METKGKEEEEIKDDTDSWSPDAWKNSTAFQGYQNEMCFLMHWDKVQGDTGL